MHFYYKDYKINYEVHGSGKPILILNGIMMSTKSWSEFIDPLTQYSQLILLDFLNQGESDKTNEQFYHDTQVEIVKGLLDELKLDKINIYGVSYGGEIAIQFAIKYPELVDKLVLSNTCSETSYWLEEVGHAWNEATSSGISYYLTTIPFIYSPKFFVENREWMENRKKILVPLFEDETFINSMKILTNSSEGYSAKDRLSEIKAETLIIGCEYDFVTPYYQQEELHENIKNSQLLFIPDSGHALMYEKPTLFILTLLGFVNNNKTTFNL